MRGTSLPTLAASSYGVKCEIREEPSGSNNDDGHQRFHGYNLFTLSILNSICLWSAKHPKPIYKSPPTHKASISKRLPTANLERAARATAKSLTERGIPPVSAWRLKPRLRKAPSPPAWAPHHVPLESAAGWGESAQADLVLL